MMNLQGILIGAGLSALVSGGIVWQIKGAIDKGACAVEIDKVSKAAAIVIDRKDAEISTLTAEKRQAQGEVDKVNAESARQVAENEALRTVDQAKRDEAAIRVERAAQQAARDARTTAERVLAALEAMKANATDKCVNADVAGDVRKLLDGILTPSTPEFVTAQCPPAPLKIDRSFATPKPVCSSTFPPAKTKGPAGAK